MSHKFVRKISYVILGNPNGSFQIFRHTIGDILSNHFRFARLIWRILFKIGSREWGYIYHRLG